MSEGGVYLTGWKKTPRGYLVWLENRPAMRAEADTLNDAQRDLCDRICVEMGDGEATFEFEPPLPVDPSVERFFRDDFVWLTPNSHFGLRTPASDLFTGGACRTCGHAVGRRTDVPITAYVGDDADALFLFKEPARFLIVSGEFLSLLSCADKTHFDTRPVRLENPSRKRFFEIIPKSPLAPIAISGLTSNGWRCAACGYSNLMHQEFGYGTAGAVCRFDLPSAAPDLFFIGLPHDVELCMPRARWRTLRGRPGTRRILATRVPVAEAAECVQDPPLKPR